MPIYEYTCKACNEKFDQLHRTMSSTDDAYYDEPSRGRGWLYALIALAILALVGGLAYLLASDGHGGHRSHTLGVGGELARRAGASGVRARQLTEANPAFLLRRGLPAIAPRPLPSTQRRAAAA